MVANDASAIAAAMIDRLAMDDRYRKEPERLGLFVADTTPFSDVIPALDAGAALGAEVVPVVDTSSRPKPLAELGLWSSKTTVDWKVAKDFVPGPSFAEEEPPVAYATPVGGEEGRMGTLSRGARKEVTVSITLKPGRITALTSDGRSFALRDASDIEMLIKEAGGRGFSRPQVTTTLSVAPDVPWSEVVDLLVSACPRSLQLVR